eukprot:6206589-Pleurochrysis_carterae.AAC.1
MILRAVSVSRHINVQGDVVLAVPVERQGLLRHGARHPVHSLRLLHPRRRVTRAHRDLLRNMNSNQRLGP